MRLGYRVDGPDSAPPLVLSPSLGTTLSLWEPQLGDLTRNFRVIRHDHPGHGISPIPAEAVTVAAIAGGVLGILDDLGIIATIAWFSRNFSKTFEGIRIELDLRVAEANVPVALKTTIYRVMQEAMNNIAKHAGANLIWIRLRNASAGLELIIEDNGRGFDLPQIAAKPHGGIGLASMRERVGMSGGEFWIQSTPRVGTMVRATWPKGRGGR